MARNSTRGFAAMDQERQREIASRGGRAAHRSGKAHEFDAQEAREAGRRGGEAVSRDRQHMAEIGARGGHSSHGDHRQSGREDDRAEPSSSRTSSNPDLAENDGGNRYAEHDLKPGRDAQGRSERRGQKRDNDRLADDEDDEDDDAARRERQVDAAMRDYDNEPDDGTGDDPRRVERDGQGDVNRADVDDQRHRGNVHATDVRRGGHPQRGER